MKKEKKRRYSLIFVLLCLVGLVIWAVWSNMSLQTTWLTVKNPTLPKGFEGFRIAQVSDLHNAQLGENNAKLLTALEQVNPDIIVITGDLIDGRKTDLQVAVDFAHRAVAIAPTYFVSGNHEQRLGERHSAFCDALRAVGVTTLENEKLTLERGGDTIVLAGIQDPYFMTEELYGTSEYMTATRLERLALAKEDYTILLSHRPELWQVYENYEIDLVFTGHAHGGQFRFPWGGGLFAPDQGFFPDYTQGAHQFGDTTMIVSRGLGNSQVPFRFNNRPELVVAVLTAD